MVNVSSVLQEVTELSTLIRVDARNTIRATLFGGVAAGPQKQLYEAL
jgi:hypothetical protein